MKLIYQEQVLQKPDGDCPFKKVELYVPDVCLLPADMPSLLLIVTGEHKSMKDYPYQPFNREWIPLKVESDSQAIRKAIEIFDKVTF